MSRFHYQSPLIAEIISATRYPSQSNLMNCDIAMSDIRGLDPLLLLTFEAPMDTHWASLSTTQLGFTRSAASGILKPLRDTFDDTLFEPRSHGLVPTQRAKGLSVQIGEAPDMLRLSLLPANLTGPTRKAELLFLPPTMQFLRYWPCSGPFLGNWHQVSHVPQNCTAAQNVHPCSNLAQLSLSSGLPLC